MIMLPVLPSCVGVTSITSVSLRRARELGDYLIVGVTSDSFDKDRGKLNVRNNILERVEAVRKTGYADEIIIEKYGVDVFAIGSDWKNVIAGISGKREFTVMNIS